MKVLTVKNPWATLIAQGFKDVENRSWPIKYRGTILIHTSQKLDKNGHDWLLLNWGNLGLSKTPMEKDCYGSIFFPETMNYSAIIARVDIVDCIKNSNSVWAEAGQWHWILKNAKMFKAPIVNIKGSLGLWNTDLIFTL